jgi:3-isopropylmalate/(R)-2-methylmalate dehydratase small subunit
MILKGKIIKYNEKNINTDLIIPARFLTTSDHYYLGMHCMEDLDPNFIMKIKKNGYSILMAGSNFGCGSSREQAPIALKAAGIKCVIANSFARIFFRNSINIGLTVVEFNNMEEFHTNDDIELDLRKGNIKNLSTNTSYRISVLPDFIQEIINTNGLIQYAKRRLEKIRRIS